MYVLYTQRIFITKIEITYKKFAPEYKRLIQYLNSYQESKVYYQTFNIFTVSRYVSCCIVQWNITDKVNNNNKNNNNNVVCPTTENPKNRKETKVKIQYCMTIEYNLSWYPILACYLSQPSHVHNQTFGTYVSSQFTNHFSEGYTPYQIDLKIILKTSKSMKKN